MDASSHRQIRQLLDDYLQMYAARDDRLTALFSEDFSGFTGGGDFLVKDKESWVEITRQDFAQVKAPIRIELKDVSIQSLAETIAVATSFFAIHLPMKDHVLSRETARLVLIFRKESAGWKISHSSISIPYHLVREGEIYPLKELSDRNQTLEGVIAERTEQLSKVNDRLQQANAALQRSEERYRSILNASPDDITITDREGRIVMVSPMAKTMFRYAENMEYEGRPVTDFLVPEDRERARAQVARKYQGLITGPSEYRGLRCDGTTFDIEINSELIRDAAGSPAGMVVIARDISERKQAAAEKEKLEAQNRLLQKAESLGRMAGAIAHHFNNQLQAVMLGLESVRDNLPENTKRSEGLSAAMQSARKAAEVSTLMLTYLGQPQGKHEALDLAEVCRGSLSLLRAAMPQSMVLATDLAAPGPTINANRNQLQQVLTNLITNAWEASGDRQDGIRLRVRTVTATEIPAARRFPVDYQTQEKAYACLEVADAGCGITANEIDKLFDPFFSTKFTGRGLGLPVVLGIARSHDGVVTVESEPGRGSVFRVFFPVSAEAVLPKSVEVPVEPASSNVRRGTTVLVVEDEPMIRATLAYALRRAAFPVLEAEDGVAAVTLLNQQRDEIGCVVCDLTMPRMNGWDTLTALRQLVPGLPVILASGYSEAQVMEGDHPERPQAFLQKPYEVKVLVATINQLLPHRRA